MNNELITYTVTLRYQHPNWDTKNGTTYEVEGRSKSDAIRSARRQAELDGNAGVGVLQGRQTWKAVPTADVIPDRYI